MSNTSAEDIENLIELFNRSDWEQMHLKTDDLELFLSNDADAQPPGAVVAQAAPAPAVAAGAVAAAPATSAEPAAAATTASSEIVVPEGMLAVRAPNLGTFYRSPKPGSPPYVEIGQSVDADTEVCLIEVMKLFTPVKAGVSGVIKEICASDADMVEFEQVLIIIEPQA